MGSEMCIRDRLLFMQGASTEGESPAAPSPAGVSAARAERLRHQRAAVPPQAGRDLAGRLDRAGVRAQYLAFPGMPHGPMLAASLPPIDTGCAPVAGLSRKLEKSRFAPHRSRGFLRDPWPHIRPGQPEFGCINHCA